MRVVIPSRKRAGILPGALRLFPDASVCVAESERADYAAFEPLVVHPDSVVGVTRVRQWILDNYTDETILFVDDDTIGCVSLVNPRRVTKIENPDDIRQIVENAELIAKEIGASLFGFNRSPNQMQLMPMDPVSFSRWFDPPMGFIGRKHKLDQTLPTRADVEVLLQALLKDRILYSDRRFCFLHKRFTMAGGNTFGRDYSADLAEIRLIQARWGRYVKVYSGIRSALSLLPIVPRRKALDYLSKV